MKRCSDRERVKKRVREWIKIAHPVELHCIRSVLCHDSWTVGRILTEFDGSWFRSVNTLSGCN